MASAVREILKREASSISFPCLCSLFLPPPADPTRPTNPPSPPQQLGISPRRPPAPRPPPRRASPPTPPSRAASSKHPRPGPSRRVPAVPPFRSSGRRVPAASAPSAVPGRRFPRLLRDYSRRRNLAGGMSAEAGNGKDGSHGSVRCAGSDPQLRQMLDSLKSSKSSAVINYGASWCGVCNQILPPFYKFSNEFKNLTFVYAHVDECPETTQNIRYTPTFHFYRDGERVDEMFGAGRGH
ncbi:formin-like protein 5 [Triticum urartu]|uniref:formin-like protein 5 n=1 Tax=Triticum urartu TaxID=4572 RepID=UPI002044B395|nr:formin-like protein 5 [Triticum urartu]